MRDVFIAGAVRTPIGKFGGGLSSLTAPQLGAAAVRGLLERTGVAAKDVETLVFGHARQAGSGPNPARQVLVGAGIPVERAAFTVNMACASGLKSVALAALEVARGEAECAVAGGMESMSRMPFLLEPGARWGYKMGHQPLVDDMYRDGFLCPMCGLLMGETADLLAERYKIPRHASDAYSARSQRLCEEATAAGKFRDEIVPVEIEGKKGKTRVEADEHSRAGVTMEALAKMEPVFSKTGTVTAGNASGITDGAAALLVASEAFVKAHTLTPLARVADWTEAGVEPRLMGLGPVPAVTKLWARQKLKPDDVDLYELNEAFACQVLACLRDLSLLPERMNVNGGAIALGHPIGATGARIVVTLAHEMKRRTAKRGVATLCVSGGLGIAMLLEKP